VIIDKPNSNFANERIVEDIKEIVNKLHLANSGGSVVVSINGSWGSGKSTILQKLKSDYEQEKKVIYFEAWRYAKESDIFLALLENLYSVIDRSSTKGKLTRVIKTLGVSALVGADIIVQSLVKKAFDIEFEGIEDIKNVFKLVEKKARGYITNTTKEQEELKKILNEITKDKELVVLIDDLDRLEPKVAYSLLERLRFFFEGDRVTIIMAINDEIINSYVHKTHSIDIPGAMSESFIDKIFHFSYELSNDTFNDNHLSSIDECFRGYIAPIKNALNKLNLKLPHRKWINIFNRLESEICKSIYVDNANGVGSVPIEKILFTIILKELFLDFNYMYRDNPDILLLSPNSDEIVSFLEGLEHKKSLAKDLIAHLTSSREL